MDDQTTTNKRSPSEPPVHYESDKSKYENSILDTGSLVESYVDLFALLELWDNVSAAFSEVESLDKSVAQLNSKLDAKVSGLETKLDAILLSLTEVKKPGPSDEERAQKLD